MIGFRGPRILQTASLVAGLLLAVMHSPMGMFPSSGAGELLATPTAERDSPLVENATPRPAELPDLDPALDDAWHRYGCHLKRSTPQFVRLLKGGNEPLLAVAHGRALYGLRV
jgi:hypothetical protein